MQDMTRIPRQEARFDFRKVPEVTFRQGICEETPDLSSLRYSGHILYTLLEDHGIPDDIPY